MSEHNDAYSNFDSGKGDRYEEFVSGERMCQPSSHGRGSTMLSAAIVIAFGLGCFAVLKHNPDLANWLSAKVADARASLEREPIAPEIQQAAISEPPIVLQSVTAREVIAAPGAEAGTPAPPSVPAEVQTESTPAETESAAETPEAPQPLTPPTVDPADPYQKRAVAIGLHPDLSKSLLKRMTTDDFRNGGLAIRKALAETPDGDVYLWPRKAQPKLAQFEVRFVQGAPHDCRRYVVSVIKDRWSTTALPMEKCGISTPTGPTKATSVE